MPASNTKACFREFIGQRVRGVLFDALPINSEHCGSKTLIFDDGRGLTINGNGAFWIDEAEEVRRAIDRRKKELGLLTRDLQEALAVAGEPT